MADHFSLCLITTMDHLWFHHIILFAEPPTTSSSLLPPKTLIKPSQDSQPTSESSTCPSSSVSLSPPSDIEDEEKSSSSDSSPTTQLGDSSNEDEEKAETNSNERRPTRLNLITARTRSHSSSPTTEKRVKYLRQSGSMSNLQKTMSSRSLWELELEEVKGFMDLGFVFEKENLSPRMMSVVPGLQRLDIDTVEVTAKEIEEIDEELEEYEKGIMRPYLSEAWVIKRPDSPLLKLRMPRVTAAADMKKHIRFWAKTVASVLQQEC